MKLITHFSVWCNDSHASLIPFNTNPAMISSIIVSIMFYAGIDALLQKSFTLRGQVLTLKQVDLDQVFQPYLVVQNVHPFVTEQALTHHFEGLYSSKVHSIHIVGTEAYIHFVEPKGLVV